MTTKVAKKYKLRIDEDLCKSCRLCVEFCPKEVLEMTSDTLNSNGVPFARCVHGEDCIGCQICTLMCPEAAIELFQVDEN